MLDVLENADRRELIARFARPAPLPGGYEPEQRVVYGGVGWAGHLELDEAFGHDRSAPRNPWSARRPAGYERLPASRLLPAFPVAALETAVDERDVVKARRAFRAAL
jgi:hypothetical protein